MLRAEKNIDLDCLRYLSKDDINELIPEISDRIKFKARLEEWKVGNVCDEYSIISIWYNI